MAKAGFVVNVADLLYRPGARRKVHLSATLDWLRVLDTSVPGGTPVDVDANLEWVSEGVLATGSASAPWVADCRRCLTAVEGEMRAEFQELFEPEARDGESYPMMGDRIDLGMAAREALLLELPLAPLCQEACKGLCPTCGADLNAGPCGCDGADAPGLR